MVDQKASLMPLMPRLEEWQEKLMRDITRSASYTPRLGKETLKELVGKDLLPPRLRGINSQILMIDDPHPHYEQKDLYREPSEEECLRERIRDKIKKLW